MNIDLAVFDIAGTTVQEHGLVYSTLEQTVRDAGADVTSEDIREWMGADKREAIRALLGREDVEEVHAQFRTRLAGAYRERPPEPFPAVPETFAQLRAQGAKIALTTGFDREITDALLEIVGWRDLDAVICADDVPAGRPAPYMIFRAMERTGAIDVARVLVAGDTVLDLRAGANAGAGTVFGVLTGGVPEETLAAEQPTAVLEDLSALFARV